MIYKVLVSKPDCLGLVWISILPGLDEVLVLDYNVKTQGKVLKVQVVPPADVVGLAGGLQLQAAGLQLLLVGADGHDGLAAPLGAGGLVADRAGAEQHPVAVLRGDLRGEGDSGSREGVSRGGGWG